MSVHDFVYTFVSSLVALFPVINPIGSALIINGMLPGLEGTTRRAASKRIALNCLLIAIGSLVAGHLVLLLFSLAVPVIQLGGGIIICKTAWDLLSDSSDSENDVKKASAASVNMESIKKKLFYPLSFPISVGPGSIAIIFTLMATTSVKGDVFRTSVNYAIIVCAIITLLVMLYVVLVQGPKITKKLGVVGNLIINKLIAFIMLCIGLQIVLAGVEKIFHLTLNI